MAAKQGGKEKKPNSAGGTELILPISRVRTIMKSSPDVDNIAQEALQAVTLSTEMFIRDITVKMHHANPSTAELEYDHLAELVNNGHDYEFLEEVIPKKLSGKEILEQRNSTT